MANLSTRGIAAIGGGLLLALAAFTLPACSGARPPAPLNAQSAALGVTLENHWADPEAAVEFPDTVYFVRLREGEQPASRRRPEIIPSNFRSGRRIYLLNALPGRYVVVAASEAVPKTGPRTEEVSERVAALGGLDEFRVVTAYFDRNLVESTAVEVAPGSFQFVASLILELDADIEDGDDTQLHFYPIVDEGLRDPFGKPIVDPDNSLALRAKLRERRRDETTERNFLNDSLRALRGTGWGEHLRRRLDALERKRG